MRSLDFVEKDLMRRDLPPFRVGDAVRVHVKVTEGDKERIQVFEGLVIRRRGAGSGETFTVRKVTSGVGVERIFPLQSPVVTKVEIKSRGYVRRSRLYYLRDLSGKKARLQSKVRDLSEFLSPEQVDARDVEVDEDEVAEAAPAVETAAEEQQDGALRGKARKRAKARAKAERMKKLGAEAAERAAAKEAEETKRAAEEAAAAEEPATEEAPEEVADAEAEEAEETEES